MRKTIFALAFTMVASSELFAGTLLWGFDGSALVNLNAANLVGSLPSTVTSNVISTNKLVNGITTVMTAGSTNYCLGTNIWCFPYYEPAYDIPGYSIFVPGAIKTYATVYASGGLSTVRTFVNSIGYASGNALLLVNSIAGDTVPTLQTKSTNGSASFTVKENGDSVFGGMINGNGVGVSNVVAQSAANGFTYDIMAGAFVPTLSSGLYGGAQPLGGFYAMSLATANVAYYSIPARLFTSQRTNVTTFSVMSTNNVGYGNSVTFTLYAFKTGGNYDSIDGGAATVTHSAGTNTWTLSRTNGTGTAWSGYSMIMAALYNGGTNRVWILEGKSASTP